MLGRRYDNPHFQSDFYRLQYQKFLRWLLIALAMIFLLVGAIVYLIFTQPVRHYYANTSDGQMYVMPETIK